MVFSSNIFLFVFLPCVLVLYFILKKFRNYVLLISSLFFYFWGGPNYLFVMLISIMINYISGLFIGTTKSALIKKTALVISIFCNLGLLFYFKYLNFSVTIFNEIFGINIPLKNIVLPIGISFFTFQGMSYVIDLYRGQVKVQKNITKIALYISLFPQLIAGPIVRYKDINEQIEYRTITLEGFSQGVRRFILGLGKKTIIANTVALTADNIFSAASYQTQETATVWLGIICYTLQIYFDFSGYSDMAIGLGKMFGFKFLENFNYPYISKSISEFWRRWHISLSSFFRDYLYIPLGGNRKGNVYVNLMIVFLATGIWHGASMNFVVWGIWHGLFMLLERFGRNSKISDKIFIPNIIKHIYTMLIVMVGWVMFRADNLSRAFEYLKRMFGIGDNENVTILIGNYIDNYLIVVLAIGILISTPIIKNMYSAIKRRCNVYVAESMQIMAFLVFSVFLFMKVMTSTYNPFIYFRF